MPQLLYAAELTPDSPTENLLTEKYNFCELTHAVLNWSKADSDAQVSNLSQTNTSLQWLVEVSPGKGRDYFAVCRLSPRYPDAKISCIALPEGSMRLTPQNEAAKRAEGVVVHVSGDYDPTGELESFYAVSCVGTQPWKISSKVEFFETFSVVIRGQDVISSKNRAYVQVYYQGKWVNVAHIPGDRMWTLVKDRLVVKGDKIRCVVYGPAAQTSFKWDAVTTLADFDEHDDDDEDPFLAEAEEVSEEEEDKKSKKKRSKRRSRESEAPKDIDVVDLSSEDTYPVPQASPTKKQRTKGDVRKSSPLGTPHAARKAAVIRPSQSATRPMTPPKAAKPEKSVTPPPRQSSPTVEVSLTDVERIYLKDIRRVLQEEGPCRLSTLGAKVKRPSGVGRKLIDFLRSKGEFDIYNSDIVSLRK